MASLKVKEILCLIYSGLLFLSGIILIGFSVVLAYKLFYHFKFAPSSALGPLIIIFILGLIHLLMTWLGVRGPTREHEFHIIMFIVVSVVLFLIHFGVGIWSLVLRQQINTVSVNLMQESFRGLTTNEFDKNEAKWAWTQSKLKCCAINGVEDYGAKQLVPCCIKPTDTKCLQGCKDPLLSYLKKIVTEAAILSFLSGIFQALGAGLFFWHLKQLQKDRAERVAHLQTLRRGEAAQTQTNTNTTPTTRA